MLFRYVTVTPSISIVFRNTGSALLLQLAGPVILNVDTVYSLIISMFCLNLVQNVDIQFLKQVFCLPY
jgi:hypothetical protein